MSWVITRICFNPLNSGATHSTGIQFARDSIIATHGFNPLNSGATHSTPECLVLPAPCRRPGFNPLNSGATHSTPECLVLPAPCRRPGFNPLNSGATHSTLHYRRTRYRNRSHVSIPSIAGQRIRPIMYLGTFAVTVTGSFNPLNSGATHSTIYKRLRVGRRYVTCFNPLNSGATHSTKAMRIDQFIALLHVSIPSIAGQRIRPSPSFPIPCWSHAASFNPLNSGATHSTLQALRLCRGRRSSVSIPSIAGQRIRPSTPYSNRRWSSEFQSPQ